MLPFLISGRRKCLAGLLLVLLSAVVAQAQNKTVTGVVADSNGNPIPGVTALLKGTSVWTVTDANGRFHLSVPDGGDGVLEFQCVGFDPKEVALSGANEYNIRLDDTISELDEVVVVGYGEQKKVNLTGAVSSMRVSDIADIPASNTASLLQGRMSGVTVTNFSAQPGKDDLEIRIRGIGTFNNADPLVIIDGVEGNLGSVSVEDIESISVLKDAAAAAIYGVRAANGVVLVTTKRGGGASTLTYSGSVGLQSATILPEFVDSWQWATLFNEENAVLGDITKNYTDDMIRKMKDGSDPDHFANTNWMKVLFRAAPVHKHYLSMTGGSKDSHYMASVGYLNQEGIMLGTSTNRTNFRLNADTRFLDFITVGINTAGSYQSSKEPQGGVWDIFNFAANKTRPTIPTYYKNGEYGAYDGNPNFTSYSATPLYQTSRSQFTDSYKFDGKLYAAIEPVRNLEIRSSFAYQIYDDKFKSDALTHRFYTAEGTYLENGIPSLDIADTVRDQWIQENVINYHFDLSDAHHFSFLLGESTQHNGIKYTASNGMYFLTDKVHVLDAAQTTAAYGNESYANLFSIFARFNYNYRNRYLFEANLRRDESSRIPSKNRAGYFPSFSAGWNIAEEPFIKDQSTVNVLKLRASWGKLGNQEIGYYPYSATYSIGESNYIWGSTKMIGAAATSAANEDIRWEVTRTFDIGLDLSMFRDRLSASIDYFDKLSSDILLQLPVSALLGVTEAPFVNAAKVSNRGWDVNLGYRDHFEDFYYGINVNFSHVDNKIISVNERENWIDGWTINREGAPIGAYFGYVADGLYTSQAEIDATEVKIGAPNVGDIKYKNLGDDTEITDEDRTVIGNPFPKFTYGVNLTAGWKNIDFAMFLQGIAGVERVFLDFPTVEGGVTAQKYDRYHATNNPGGTFPAMGNQAYNQMPSSFWVKDASYLRLKNLELGYTFPRALKGIRVYFSGQNLLTFTRVVNFDPEKNPNDTNNATYPNARVVSLGVNVKL